MYRWVGGGGWWLLKRGELRVGWRGDFKWASTSVFEKGWWGRGRGEEGSSCHEPNYKCSIARTTKHNNSKFSKL